MAMKRSWSAWCHYRTAIEHSAIREVAVLTTAYAHCPHDVSCPCQTILLCSLTFSMWVEREWLTSCQSLHLDRFMYMSVSSPKKTRHVQMYPCVHSVRKEQNRQVLVPSRPVHLGSYFPRGCVSGEYGNLIAYAVFRFQITNVQIVSSHSWIDLDTVSILLLNSSAWFRCI